MGDTIKRFTRRIRINNGLSWLLAINLMVYVLLAIGALFLNFTSTRGASMLRDSLLSLPASAGEFIRSPWSIVTYMFTQFSLSHLLFNMIFLAIVGRVACRYLDSKKIVRLYCVSGISGAIFFLGFYASIPSIYSANSYLEGASAAIYGILVFSTLYNPDLKLNLLALDGIKIKWITSFFLILNLFGLGGENYAANLAHLGGAFGGTVYFIVLRIWKKDPHPTGREDKELNAILEKIKVSGYSSLNEEERKILMNRSK